MAKKETSRAHCNTCSRDNKHVVLASKKLSDGYYDDTYGDINWTDLYEMLECCGCESISLRHTYWFEPTDRTEVTLYPPAVTRRPPEWRLIAPDDVRRLMDEVYSALAADSRSLAMMGARALVDMALVKVVGDVGSFPQKLDAAEKAGVLAQKNRDVLAAALDAGSAAAHRGYRAGAEDVSAVMDIVENLLQAVYHFESLATMLKKKTPPRRQTKV